MHLHGCALLFISLFQACVSSSNRTYSEYKLIRAFPTQKSHFELLERLEQTDTDFDVWNALKVEPASFDILLPPAKSAQYTSLFQSMNMRVDIINANIQK